ncbi:14864_t:CDS:1 [Cetraspora pellucida]|uniref:14864_t:CDS:1 n=1 Tax=Cetraspora pellucida TaxID=1433469 RepID=A0A9N9NDP2_9GLOM|nr:14864_t:CDS:1 [Cetraspora pellucida]
MPFCTSCSCTLSSTEFIYESKSYKTCARCITNKAIKKDNLDEKTIIEAISIQDISNYITNVIADLEHCLELSLVFHIQLDKITLGIVDTDVKAMTILIINEIENDDKYNWTVTTALNLLSCYIGVENAYYLYFQSYELEHEYKNSSKKRISRFNCNGKILIKIDISAAEAKVILKHEMMHEKPDDIAVSLEIKQEIKRNLNLSPVDLRTHLCSKNFDMSKIIYKQIHY